MFHLCWVCVCGRGGSLPDSELICIKAQRSGVEEETWHFAQSGGKKVGREWWGIGPILTLRVSLYSMCALCHDHGPATPFISVMHRMPWLGQWLPRPIPTTAPKHTHTHILYCVARRQGPLFYGFLIAIYKLSSFLNAGNPDSRPNRRPLGRSIHHLCVDLFLLLCAPIGFFFHVTPDNMNNTKT